MAHHMHRASNKMGGGAWGLFGACKQLDTQLRTTLRPSMHKLQAATPTVPGRTDLC
jgi:hypothetical protein